MADDFEQLPDEPEWYKGFNRTKAGAIRGTVMSNVVLVLQNDPLFDRVFKFNDFTEEEEIAKTIKIAKHVMNTVDIGFCDYLVNASDCFYTDTVCRGHL